MRLFFTEKIFVKFLSIMYLPEYPVFYTRDQSTQKKFI